MVDKVAANLKARFPNLHIVGTYHSYFDKTPGSPENEAVIRQINAVKPNILVVGFGMPLQGNYSRRLKSSSLGTSCQLSASADNPYVRI